MVIECSIVKLNELVLIVGTVFNVIWEARLPGTSSAVPTSFSPCVVSENGIHGSVQKHILKTLELLNWLSLPVPMMRIKEVFVLFFYLFIVSGNLRNLDLECFTVSHTAGSFVHKCIFLIGTWPNRYLVQTRLVVEKTHTHETSGEGEWPLG